jgi:polyisoprenoid-binding protein YceI
VIAPLKVAFVVLLSALLLPSVAAGAQGVLVDKSEIRFVSKQMGVNVEGRFRKWKASVAFDPKDLAHSKADLDIDLGSIDLASEDSEAEMKGKVWFDTARFPSARFVSSAIRATGPDRYEVVGALTIKGITRDAVVPLALTRDGGGNSVAEGTFTVKRLEFHVGEGEWADPTTVANDVQVRVRMVLAPLP